MIREAQWGLGLILIVLIHQHQGQSPLTTGREAWGSMATLCPHKSPILRREPLGEEQICSVEHSGTGLDTGSCDLSGPKKPLHHEQRGSREHSDDVHVHLATVVTEASSSNFTPETAYGTIQLSSGAPLPTCSDIPTVCTTLGPTQEPLEVLPTSGDTPTIQMTDIAGDSVISPEELHFSNNSINPDDIFDGSTFVVGRPLEAILDMIQEECELECLWKSGSFTGSIESTPSATVHKKCYELFKKEYCDTWQDILLKFEESSIVNQDAPLGYAYTMPGTEDFFMEHCHTDTNAIISHFKVHIYLMVESHGQSWASGKLFPWKQLPQKLGQNALVGGGKTTNRTAEDDGHSSSSLSPIPRMLRSMMHKAAVRERDSSGKGAPKSMYGCRKVEVVVTMTAKKLGKRPPSIITIRDSSEPGETNIGVERMPWTTMLNCFFQTMSKAHLPTNAK
ncbi:hypothetical protein F5141DRAFT_1063395 [Pisolithus sp. B1]|nr:hypothetical protein F5141DRAFT_1063395 [Pisolithus sp. B1]